VVEGAAKDMNDMNNLAMAPGLHRVPAWRRSKQSSNPGVGWQRNVFEGGSRYEFDNGRQSSGNHGVGFGRLQIDPKEWASDCLRQTVGCAMVIEPNSESLSLERWESGTRRVDGELCRTAIGSIRQSASPTESISNGFSRRSSAISKSESEAEPFYGTSRLIEVTRHERVTG
jgi:hypothetical protein